MAKIFETDDSIVIAAQASSMEDIPAALDKAIEDAMQEVDHTVHVMMAGDVLDWLLGNDELVHRFIEEQAMTEERKGAAKTVGFSDEQVSGRTVHDNLRQMRDEFSEYVGARQSHLALAFAAIMLPHDHEEEDAK